MEDHSTNHWAEGLASVIFSINTRTAFSTKKTPYELVFGQDIRTNNHYWESIYDSALTDSVTIDDMIIDKIPLSNTSITSERRNSSIMLNSINLHTERG